MDQPKIQNIFIKQSELPKETYVLKYDDIQKSIPNDAVTEINYDLQKTNNEWRWRFFKCDEKVLVEISIRIPDTIDEHGVVQKSVRKYINKHGKMVVQDIDESFDKYVTKQYYYYTSE